MILIVFVWKTKFGPAVAQLKILRDNGRESPVEVPNTPQVEEPLAPPIAEQPRKKSFFSVFRK